ncbi:hypothetical protein GX48_00796 [Paracoccidioides brasiliensis]|nr:hypothetical protein GX48_00796 [Paracoccidioides brasiliensis]
MATYMSQDDISLLESVCRTLFVNFFVKEASMKNSVYIVFDVVDEVYGYEMQSMINLMKDINEVMLGRPQLTDPFLKLLKWTNPRFS